MRFSRRAVLVLPLFIATVGNAVPYGLSGTVSGAGGISTFEWGLSAAYALAAVGLAIYLFGWWTSRFIWTLSAAVWGASVGHAIVLHHAIDRQKIALALIFLGYCLRALMTVVESDRDRNREQEEVSSGVGDN